ncbi:MAG: iron(III) transport system substrate-binding protein [Acetobacteraceae bacterium]|jgi:iron(III) transport system substrate-binding protein|nr:transporter substrate-binding protein [Rhodopila sp.]MEA2728051.1 iron(III) transport system substrate-binding protein [Acetobacteraceae bacterium]
MHRLNRRSVLTGLGTLAVATPLRARAAGITPELIEAARKEGSVTWYIAQVDTATAEAMGNAFTKQFPGVTVSVIRTTGQVAYERLLQDLKNGAPQCDVFSSTDTAQYPALKKRNALADYTPAGAATLLPAFAKVSDPGYTYPSSATAHLLIYNSMQVKPADAPKAWTDLLDPRWKGRVATGHPAFSGCTGIWALALTKTYGWSYFEKLAKNNPRIGRSGNDPVTLINAGECLVGPSPGNTAFQQVDKGNPIVPVYPTDGATLCLGPSSVMASAPHPNAARLYMEWLMSDAFSKLSVANHGDPVHPGLALTSGQKPLDQVPILSLTVEEIAKGVPEIVEQWRDTFGG